MLADWFSRLPLSSVLYASHDAFKHQLPEPLAPALVDMIKARGFTHVLAAHSSWGKNLFPRIAALLDVSQVSDIMAIEAEDTFVRPIYAGNAIATVRSQDAIKLVTVRATAFDQCAQDGNATAEEIQLNPAQHRSAQWVGESVVESERPDLASASKVVSGGRALKDKASFDGLLQPLADVLGAAIGASRAAVDGGLADNSLQVGQTGKVVAPQLYIAIGISGAIQHLAGMQDSKVIVAINKVCHQSFAHLSPSSSCELPQDADCPIMGVADHGLVGDIFQIIPELTEKLKAASK